MPMQPNPETDFEDPLTAMMRAWSSMVAAVPPTGTAADKWLGSAQTLSRGPGAQINTVLMQAQAAASGAMMRGWQRGARSWAEYCRSAGAGTPALASAVGAEALARNVDDARAHVRRLAEIAADEARLLAAQLSSIDEQLRAVVPDADPADAARRFARAKD